VLERLCNLLTPERQKVNSLAGSFPLASFAFVRHPAVVMALSAFHSFIIA
jgi:hypothetical protein